MTRYLRTAFLVALLPASAGCAWESNSEPPQTRVLSQVSTDAMEAQIRINNEWNGGYCASVVVTNKTAQVADDWLVEFDLRGDSIENTWNAKFDVRGDRVEVSPLSWNSRLGAGQTRDEAGFCATTHGAQRAEAVRVHGEGLPVAGPTPTPEPPSIPTPSPSPQPPSPDPVPAPAPEARGPYGGTPPNLPGTVQAERFDTGGAEVAYRDSTTKNQGGDFRDTAVDVQAHGGGGHNVGWIREGEWLAYTVTVEQPGTYDVEFRVASAQNGGKLSIELPSGARTSSVSFPSTGGWQTYTTVELAGVELSAGEQSWKILMEQSGFNLDSFTVREATAVPPPPVATTRDAWEWPFAADSIWNMPIGSNADYRPAHLRAAGHVGVDTQHILATTNADPLQEVRATGGWGPGRCSGTEVLPFQVRIPDWYVIPDAGNSPYGGTPNSNFAFLQPDGQTVYEGVLMSRCVAGGPVYLPGFSRWPNNRHEQSIRGDGISGGGQGASLMSALGGTLRKGELTGSAPIRHAIKINPWGEVDLYYSPQIPGYKWPAENADSYAAGVYGGDNPLLVMGSLLALPPDVTADELGIETEAGRKLFFTLQNYGAYFTEDAAWDTWDLIVERDAEIEFEDTYGFSMKSGPWKSDLNRLIQALHVIANNGPDSIGGGGTPRQPLAPPFSN